jgi:hypothetical protein
VLLPDIHEIPPALFAAEKVPPPCGSVSIKSIRRPHLANEQAKLMHSEVSPLF